MIFGHNTNVSAGAAKYHVQTENAGGPTALIDTVVYGSGRVLHRRTSNYVDLLPLNEEKEALLKERLDDQHRQVVEEVRSGALNLPVPVAPPRIVGSAASVASKESSDVVPTLEKTALRFELLNPKTWLTGKQASLNLRVGDLAGSAVAGAQVRAYIAGTTGTLASVESSGSGEAVLNFEMPRVSGADRTLVIAGAKGDASGQISFQLRAKQRVPTS